MSSGYNTNESFIAVVDLGTGKISLTVAKVEGNNTQILFYRAAKSEGIRNSAIFNPKKAEGVLSGLLSAAEEELKIKILSVVVGLPRCGVRQEKAEAICQRNDPDECITVEEIESLKCIAKEEHHLGDPDKEEIYGAVAQCFSTPEYFQVNENDIVGMISSEVTGHFNVFIGRRSHINNIYKVFNDLGVAISRMYFSPVATSRAVLTDEEMHNGVALLDFGAGATSVSIYRNRVLAHYASIPFGGNVVTSDIRNECSISERLAENIKCAYGGCMPDRLQTLSEKIIQIESDDMNVCNQIPVSYLSEIISAREKEIIDAMLYEISESGLAGALRKGVVITGGGAEMLNLGNYIRELSGYTVRVACPRNGFVATGCEEILKPAAVASAGMVLLAKGEGLNCCTVSEDYVAEAAADVPGPEQAGSGVEEVWNNLVSSPAEEITETPGIEEKADEVGKQPETPAAEEEPEKENKPGFFKTIAWKVQKYYNEISKETV